MTSSKLAYIITIYSIHRYIQSLLTSDYTQKAKKVSRNKPSCWAFGVILEQI